MATPEQDQFFRRVWPEEKMIWERGEIAKKDREKCLFQCPICFQPCVTHDDLKRHLKVGHTKREVKKIYVELKLAAKADANACDASKRISVLSTAAHQGHLQA